MNSSVTVVQGNENKTNQEELRAIGVIVRRLERVRYTGWEVPQIPFVDRCYVVAPELIHRRYLS